MTHQRPTTLSATSQLDDQQQWGASKTMDGLPHRHCRLCGNWFIEYFLKLHFCPVPKLRRIFEPPK